jgi:hypothetical protein
MNVYGLNCHCLEKSESFGAVNDGSDDAMDDSADGDSANAGVANSPAATQKASAIVAMFRRYFFIWFFLFAFNLMYLLSVPFILAGLPAASLPGNHRHAVCASPFHDG